MTSPHTSNVRSVNRLRLSTCFRRLSSIALMASLLLGGVARVEASCVSDATTWVTSWSHHASGDERCDAMPSGGDSRAPSTMRCTALSVCASTPALPVATSALAVVSVPRLGPAEPPLFHSGPDQAPEPPPPRA